MTNPVEQKIIHHVLDAIADQKLHAGTKLGEHELVAVFSCNRAQIRRALAMLTGYGVIELVHNKGAYVATPGEQESRHVFEARRVIEASICKNAVQSANPAGIARLRAHLAEEHAVFTQGSRADALRLSRRFHMILAELGQNDVLAQYLEELTLRSSLILGCYGSNRTSLCSSGEHERIVDAIEAGDAERAAELLDHHLGHLENDLDFSLNRGPANALASILNVATG